MAQYGFERDRFTTPSASSFECFICYQVVRQPWQCHQCGKMFCKSCINDWINKINDPSLSKCPNRCKDPKICPVLSKALIKLYNDLDIKCSNEKCEKVIKLIDLDRHQSICLKVKCWNYQVCQKIQNQLIKSKKSCCSQLCSVLLELNQNYGNIKKMYQILESICKSQVKINNQQGSSLVKINTQLSWDQSQAGTGIQLSDNNQTIFLKEQAYVFRSAVANIGFTGGINYWQIIADSKTQNQLKIGVSTSKNFDLNSAFCDAIHGFAYYGLGQLRHNSNASGPSYGKRFKKQGVLGCCLNMEKGTLSFALNGQYWGVAYRDFKLTQGTIYPAVSLLHCAGCKIRGGLKVPSYFKQ